jgi:transcriptional regulator with XRE-family HTH domain
MSRAELSSISAMKPGSSAAKAAYINRVKQLRKERGFTQRQMAEALQIPLERYKKYEQRSRLPPELLPSFAAIVGCPVERVLTDSPSPRGPRTTT